MPKSSRRGRSPCLSVRVKRAKIVVGAGFVEIEDLNSADAGLGEIECLAVGSEFGVARRLVEWDRSHHGALCKVDHDQGKWPRSCDVTYAVFPSELIETV